MQHLLEVKDLQTTFFTTNGEVKAVGNVSFNLDTGKVLGIVGTAFLLFAILFVLLIIFAAIVSS